MLKLQKIKRKKATDNVIHNKVSSAVVGRKLCKIYGHKRNLDFEPACQYIMENSHELYMWGPVEFQGLELLQYKCMVWNAVMGYDIESPLILRLEELAQEVYDTKYSRHLIVTDMAMSGNNALFYMQVYDRAMGMTSNATISEVPFFTLPIHNGNGDEVAVAEIVHVPHIIQKFEYMEAEND